MNFFKNTKYVLFFILALAALLRLTVLGSYPQGITIDEAGQGYSAYSILKTGRDEWGDFLPLNPRGFGDYKPPVYMYLLVPSVAVFGLNEFAVRFPSAIAGILTVWVIYFLGKELFLTKRAGLITAFLLSISPWHIYYSRLGWESNVGLLFFISAIWLFILSLRKNIWLPFSVLLFGLSALSYHSFKVLAPLMFFGLLFLYRKYKFKTNIKLQAAVVGIIFILILGYGFIFSGASRRAQDQAVLKEENLTQLRLDQFSDKLPQPINRMLNNKYIFLVSKVTDNYIGYYSLPFLFGPHRSDGSVLNFPTQGLFYIWQLPLLFLGIVFLFKNFNTSTKVILFWTFIAPIPASLTSDYMHAGRAQALFPALTLVTIAGILYSFDLIKKSKYVKPALIISVLVLVISLFLRIDKYLFHTFNSPHGGLVQGYKEITEYTENQKANYQKIIFTKANSEPQAFIAFYTKWDPENFQKESQNWKKFETDGLRYLDMSDYNLGKYEFKNIDISRDRNEKNSLIIGNYEEIPPSLIPVFTVEDGTKKEIFKVIKTDEIPK